MIFIDPEGSGRGPINSNTVWRQRDGKLARSQCDLVSKVGLCFHTRVTAMSTRSFAKCSCESCSVHLEYPVEAEGTSISCPQCGQQTQLVRPAPTEAPDPAPTFTVESINASF